MLPTSPGYLVGRRAIVVEGVVDDKFVSKKDAQVCLCRLAASQKTSRDTTPGNIIRREAEWERKGGKKKRKKGS